MFHVLLQPKTKLNNTPFSLAEIMKNHKSFTAHAANEILKRNGQFWHHESYDHCIREHQEFNRIISYILNNPVKADLVERYKDWEHYWLNEKDL